MRQNRLISLGTVAPQASHRGRLIVSLGALAFGLAFLATAAPTSAATPSAHARRHAHVHGSAASRLSTRATADQASHVTAQAVFTTRPSGPGVRFLSITALSHARASAGALAQAWQLGRFHHSAARPLSLHVANGDPTPPVAAAPRVTVAPAHFGGDTIHDAIYQASQRWHVSYWYLVRLATCESTLNPGAYNPSGASGLFQFMPSTYYSYAGRIGEGGSLWNPYSNANVAAYMIAQGQAYQWTCARMI